MAPASQGAKQAIVCAGRGHVGCSFHSASATAMPTFFEPRFKFSVSIPGNWAFLPPAWSPVEHLKKAAGPDDWIQFASKPFCCAMSHHDSLRHPYPTLQVAARPWAVPDSGQARQILEAQVGAFRQLHEAFDVERATHEAVISGCRANQMIGSYTLFATRDDEAFEMRVRCHNYLVFAPGMGVTMALSGSADPAYCSEADFAGIIRSVRIGARRQ